jgi:hypothetical protein
MAGLVHAALERAPPVEGAEGRIDDRDEYPLDGPEARVAPTG